jgi:ribonuclease HI
MTPAPETFVPDIIVRADGASKGNPGPAGAGVVLLDVSGQVLSEISEPLGRATNNHAEYCALIRGLEEAKRLGARRVQVLMDSELVVLQMMGVYRVRAPKLAPLWQKAKDLLGGFEAVRFRAVPRSENQAADRLASQAALQSMRQGRNLVVR